MSPEQQTRGGGTGVGGRRVLLVAGTEQAPVRCAVHGQQGQAQAPGVQVIVVEKAGPKGEGGEPGVAKPDAGVNPDAGLTEKAE